MGNGTTDAVSVSGNGEWGRILLPVFNILILNGEWLKNFSVPYFLFPIPSKIINYSSRSC